MQVWVSPLCSLCNYFFTQLTLINLPRASMQEERACTLGSLGCAAQVVPMTSLLLCWEGSAELGSALFWSWPWGFRLPPTSLQQPPPQRKTAASCHHWGLPALGFQWVQMGSSVSLSLVAQTLKPFMWGHGLPLRGCVDGAVLGASAGLSAAHSMLNAVWPPRHCMQGPPGQS